MPALKIGIAIASLRQPFAKALFTAASLGATAVEIDARTDLKPAELSQTGLRQLRKMLDDRGLRVSAIAYPTRRGYQIAEQLEARVAGTKEAMKLAYALGTSVVVNQVGRVPAESSGEEWNLLVEALTDLGRFGQHTGAQLAAQTGTESGADLARLIAALPAASIGVDLDPGSLLANDFSPIEAVEALGPHVVHVHATDGVRDLARGRGLEVPLGRGSADYPAILSRLEESGYRGWFTIFRRAAADPVAEIGAAVQYLQSL
ncbi:MAG TPA: sugar phosphate isomerase/epimerase family protein [Pirellulales bacterium]|nr:sugar phosphate isomerase/epimerase family protein [Pirellulales bacterium]